MKSSQDARDLIEAAIVRTRTDRRHPQYRKAAALLGLPESHIAALHKMRKGLMRDTKAMKAIIASRKRAARIRFLSFKPHYDRDCEDKLIAAREWSAQIQAEAAAMYVGLK